MGGDSDSATWGGITGTLDDQSDLKNALDGAGGSATWGNVTGTLDNQSDLKNALDAKADQTDLDNAEGSATWGGITGTLADQTDLNNALDGKADQTDLDNKVEKSSTNNIVYTTDGSGNQGTVPYATSPLPNTIPIRDASGTFDIPDATDDVQPTTFKQLNDGLDAKADLSQLDAKADQTELDARLSTAQRTAIDALPATGATVDDVVAALQAT
ncbi:MAG TPA: hypothetical protein VLA13_08310 [Massilibacterium sp.]|nr:hypothetical protein [Massilibacterium sp.]